MDRHAIKRLLDPEHAYGTVSMRDRRVIAAALMLLREP